MQSIAYSPIFNKRQLITETNKRNNNNKYPSTYKSKNNNTPEKNKKHQESTNQKETSASANKNIETDKNSFEGKIGVTRVKEPLVIGNGNVKMENSSSEANGLSVNKNGTKTIADLHKSFVGYTKKSLLSIYKNKTNKKTEILNLPSIRKGNNPEELALKSQKMNEIFYQSKVERAFRAKENTYLMNLTRQHFLQSIEAIKIGRTLNLTEPLKLNLEKKNPKFKTIFLDLDETLVHCDEASSNCTVKLSFPVEGGGKIKAGIRVRPYCFEFLEELSSFAEIIIFTASAPSYADVVLDYLDPENKYFAHRLYRQHCRLEKGFYTKDLRIVNRKAEEIAIVDNSAFTFMVQPEFGIPIIPFYHFEKDKELQILIKFLRELVEEKDMREKINNTFFWGKYTNEDDPRMIFQENFKID